MLNLENGTKMYFFRENCNDRINSRVRFCKIKFLTPHLLGLISDLFTHKLIDNLIKNDNASNKNHV